MGTFTAAYVVESHKLDVRVKWTLDHGGVAQAMRISDKAWLTSIPIGTMRDPTLREFIALVERVDWPTISARVPRVRL